MYRLIQKFVNSEIRVNTGRVSSAASVVPEDYIMIVMNESDRLL